MKLPITEARRRLPELVRQIRKDPGSTVQITVRDEVVAELRAALPEPEPGATGRALLEALRKLPKRRGRRIERRLSLCDAISFVVITTLLDRPPCLTFDDDFRALGLTVVT